MSHYLECDVVAYLRLHLRFKNEKPDEPIITPLIEIEEEQFRFTSKFDVDRLDTNIKEYVESNFTEKNISTKYQHLGKLLSIETLEVLSFSIEGVEYV